MRAPLVLVLIAACSAGTPGSGLDTDQVLVHVGSMMMIGPRPGDTQASRDAAAYIEQTVTALGVKIERFPVGVVDLPDIVVLGRNFRNAHRAQSTDDNLVIRFGPPGKVLLIMGHYDTVDRSPGAIDNAVAVGVLIELARVLQAKPPPFGVMLVFTANEEVGLVGAEALAARVGDDVAFAIALDLVGGSGDLIINGASRLIGAGELRWLASAADAAGVALRAPLAHRVVSRWWPQAERSDHGPFTRRGIRAVHFYNRGQDGEWIDLAYHSPRDLLARVDRASVDELGRVLVALTDFPPPPPGGPDGFWVPLAHNTVIPRAVLLAIEIALALIALISLVVARTARARGGPGVLAGIGCVVLATLVTYAIERAFAGGHPGPWLHAPRYAVIAESLVLFGGLGLLVLAVRRVRPWIGALRYLAIGAAIPLVVGVFLLAIGAAELAWIWLVPAAAIALAPRLGPARVLAPLAAALPALLVLSPDQLREMAWNGFLPPVPLAVLLGLFALPVIATGAWLARCGGATGPLGSFVLPVGCLLSVLAGVLLVSRAHPPCRGLDFNQLSLACEVTPWVR